MKRGDMSMQTIVVAVIVLLIAAILIYMTGTRLGLFDDTIGACQDRGGECRTECQGGEQPFYIGNSACQESGRGDVCCVSGDSISGE